MTSAYESRAWFITGASSGLGLALAETALERGDSVVATGRDPGAMRELEERYPGRAVAERLDVTDPGRLARPPAAPPRSSVASTCW
jgi:NAD(P)-dependent dehydrogenase (short-subunit alcohol dehydrogenase family)